MKLPPLVSAPVSPPPGNTGAAAKIQQAITSQPHKQAESVRVQLGAINKASSPQVFQPPVIIRVSAPSNQEPLSHSSERLQQQLDLFDLSLAGRNRFNGGGQRFGELLRDGETPYHQEMRRYQYYTDKSRANQPVDFSEFSISEERRTQNFDLSLTTRSGAKVSFQLQSFSGVGKNPDTVLFQSDEMTLSKAGQFASFNRTEVRFNIEGELTDDEQQQLQKFAEQLEAFAGGYFNQGKPSLKDLNLSQFDSISKLSVTGNGGGQADLKLEYHNSEDSRDIRFRFDGNKAEFKLDKTNPLSYQQPGKQQAIEHYLDLLDRSAKKSRADDMQQSMMKDVLAAGFEFSQTELNLVQPARQEKRLQNQQQDNTFNSDELNRNHLFFPLPDFDFRFSSRKDQLPTDVISLQERGFDLNLSLQTQKQQHNGKVSIQQKQSFELSGSYTERPDKDGINFRRTSFEIRSGNIINSEREQGELLSAMVEKQQSQRETVEDFNFDTLVNTEKEESEFVSADELPDSVTHTPPQQLQQQWLDQLLLNPFA